MFKILLDNSYIVWVGFLRSISITIINTIVTLTKLIHRQKRISMAFKRLEIYLNFGLDIHIFYMDRLDKKSH